MGSGFGTHPPFLMIFTDIHDQDNVCERALRRTNPGFEEAGHVKKNSQSLYDSDYLFNVCERIRINHLSQTA